MRRVVILMLVGYKRFLSPLLPSACRFHPTCSEYMREAVEKHGVGRGIWLGIRRLVRCQPFCKGGFDPVPEPMTKSNPTEGQKRRSRSGVSAVSPKA